MTTRRRTAINRPVIWMLAVAGSIGGSPGQAQQREPTQQVDTQQVDVADRFAPPARRIRVMAGGQMQPGFPGDDDWRLEPLLILSRARGNDPFPFSAPGDGNAVTLLRAGAAEFGPLARLEGRRRSGDLGGGLPTISRTVEVGGFGQIWLTPAVRLRGDVRKGIGGHEGWIGQIGADYVARDADRWLVSLGPRVVISDGGYQRSWFGITPQTAATSGLPAFRPGGGLQSVGLTSRTIFSITDRWGIMGQATYARLIDDPHRSPIIRRAGSADQLTVGLGLTYTFSTR